MTRRLVFPIRQSIYFSHSYDSSGIHVRAPGLSFSFSSVIRDELSIPHSNPYVNRSSNTAPKRPPNNSLKTFHVFPLWTTAPITTNNRLSQHPFLPRSLLNFLSPSASHMGFKNGSKFPLCPFASSRSRV